jgi:hypothetical protein
MPAVGATDNAPIDVAPRRSPVSTSNIPRTELATWAGDKYTSDRTHSDKAGADKKTDKKKHSGKHSGKKSGGKHRKS